MTKREKPRAPLNDTIIAAVAQLVDDSQADRRDPSHSDIAFEINRAGLDAGDPVSQKQTVGKAKRVRSTLSFGLEYEQDAAEVFVAALISLIRGKGGFRAGASNYVGADAIASAKDAFRTEGFVLSDDGELYPMNIDAFTGIELTAALAAYARRAVRGSEDAALVVGTSKDLLEATAAHIISERYGTYPQHAHFPMLLGQAFDVLGLATVGPSQKLEAPMRRAERALYESGCSVNAMRNKEGSGHGRPWNSTVSDIDARTAIQTMGVIAAHLLSVHKAKP
jgi:hypothetical protein